MVRMSTAVFLACLTIGSAPALGASPPTSSAQRGSALASRNCAVCHAIGTGGASPNAMAPSFRQIYRRYPAGALDEAFRQGLLTRHPSMPELRFTPAELADLVSYLRTLQGAGLS